MQRAHARCALFFAALLAALLLAASPALAQLPESCLPPGQNHGQGRVDFVYDGDTVRLTDGRRIRLIGLDTPEFHHRDERRDAEPYAEEARKALMALLAEHDHQVLIVHDRERHDRYQRTLAHLYTPDGRSITALMLHQGLGTRLTIPPNDWNVDCYRDAEREASIAQRGIWSRSENGLFDTRDLPRDSTGFRRVEGRVVRIGDSPRAIWINLEGDVALRIDREDLQFFPDLDVTNLVDTRVRGRGYVYNHRGQLRIRLRHAADLQIIAVNGPES